MNENTLIKLIKEFPDKNGIGMNYLKIQTLHGILYNPT
jgi:hypothetical protein